MRSRDWSSDVCSSDLFDGLDTQVIGYLGPALSLEWNIPRAQLGPVFSASLVGLMAGLLVIGPLSDRIGRRCSIIISVSLFSRSEEHTSELQSLMRTSYAVFCLNKKTANHTLYNQSHVHLTI